jgi:hypothetical protein
MYTFIYINKYTHTYTHIYTQYIPVIAVTVISDKPYFDIILDPIPERRRALSCMYNGRHFWISINSGIIEDSWTLKPVYIGIWIYVLINKYSHVYSITCKYRNIFIYIWTCIHICTYRHIYMFIHSYRHLYICICIS